MLGMKVRCRVRGEFACFTRPEFKTERYSYEVMTPGAARGLLESIMWKPAIRWEIESIAVLAPIKFTSVRRNEVDAVAVAGRPFRASEHRTQRSTVLLKDVDYILSASFHMTEAAGPRDNLNKFLDIWNDRMPRGRHFRMPSLGCREFPAWVDEVKDGLQPIQESRPLGYMFYDYDYDYTQQSTPRPLFFGAALNSGVLHIPSREEVLLANRR